MRVKSLMNRDVKTITPEKTIKEAARLMADFGIGSLIVVKNKKLYGIITERDILTKVVAKGVNTATPVEKIMTKNVIFVSPDIEVEEAIKIMAENKIKKLPVVSGAVLVGIISVIDLLKAEPKLIEQVAALFFLPRRTAAG